MKYPGQFTTVVITAVEILLLASWIFAMFCGVKAMVVSKSQTFPTGEAAALHSHHLLQLLETEDDREIEHLERISSSWNQSCGKMDSPLTDSTSSSPEIRVRRRRRRVAVNNPPVTPPHYSPVQPLSHGSFQFLIPKIQNCLEQNDAYCLAVHSQGLFSHSLPNSPHQTFALFMSVFSSQYGPYGQEDHHKDPHVVSFINRLRALGTPEMQAIATHAYTLQYHSSHRDALTPIFRLENEIRTKPNFVWSARIIPNLCYTIDHLESLIQDESTAWEAVSTSSSSSPVQIKVTNLLKYNMDYLARISQILMEYHQHEPEVILNVIDQLIEFCQYYWNQHDAAFQLYIQSVEQAVRYAGPESPEHSIVSLNQVPDLSLEQYPGSAMPIQSVYQSRILHLYMMPKRACTLFSNLFNARRMDLLIQLIRDDGFLYAVGVVHQVELLHYAMRQLRQNFFSRVHSSWTSDLEAIRLLVENGSPDMVYPSFLVDAVGLCDLSIIKYVLYEMRISVGLTEAIREAAELRDVAVLLLLNEFQMHQSVDRLSLN